mgnify:CR=1 FL=1
MKRFEHYFKLPLENDELATFMVFTADYGRAFDILMPGKAMQKNIVRKLNGEYDKKMEETLTYEDGEIYLNGKKFLRIRSWGRLTGGLGLKPEKASIIQDEFAEWIIETLKK